MNNEFLGGDVRRETIDKESFIARLRSQLTASEKGYDLAAIDPAPSKTACSCSRGELPLFQGKNMSAIP